MTGTDPRAGQEAARLLAAAQDWLRTSAPHLAPVADDGAPCSCPLCRAVAGLREAYVVYRSNATKALPPAEGDRSSRHQSQASRTPVTAPGEARPPQHPRRQHT